jgi:uncharacterized protein YqjF (DUF2071 family)
MAGMGVPEIAPSLRGPAIFDQFWCDLSFLHWPVDPEAVARFMPAGVRPDVFEGRSYVGLVPFQMKRARIAGLPAPYFGTFNEVNVRLYSVDEQGRHGVVFRSLDADRAAVVALARALGVRYLWSQIEVERYRSPLPGVDAALRSYRVRRRGSAAATSGHVAVRVGPQIQPSALEIFLTARWGMHSEFLGRPRWTPNQHETWPLYEAELVELEENLVAAAGVVPVGPMLRPLWSPGVHARFGVPSRVGTG